MRVMKLHLPLSLARTCILRECERVNCRHLSRKRCCQRGSKGKKNQQIPSKAVSGPFDGETGTLHRSRALLSSQRLQLYVLTSSEANNFVPSSSPWPDCTDADVSSKQVHPESSGPLREYKYSGVPCFK